MSEIDLEYDLTPSEMQSGLSRVDYAEGLIRQLPGTHDGRNTWLLNYGIGEEAVEMRRRRGIRFRTDTKAAETSDQRQECIVVEEDAERTAAANGQFGVGA